MAKTVLLTLLSTYSALRNINNTGYITRDHTGTFPPDSAALLFEFHCRNDMLEVPPGVFKCPPCMRAMSHRGALWGRWESA
jgi:hypothetical protein